MGDLRFNIFNFRILTVYATLYTVIRNQLRPRASPRYGGGVSCRLNLGPQVVHDISRGSEVGPCAQEVTELGSSS